MQKQTFALTFFVISAIAFMAFSPMYDNGIAGYTNSPNEANCTNCHNGSANTGSGSVIITSNIPNWEYTPGTTYQITVTVAQQGIGLFGLGCEALQSNNTNGGTLVITDTQHTQLKNAASSRKNVVHTFGGGTATNNKAFTFNWIAPATNIGNITFYSSGVAANGDGNNGGDQVYTTSQVATPVIVSTAQKNEAPTEIILQLLPNIATAKTPILMRYTLLANSPVTAMLCNSNGALVQNIGEEALQTAGAHEQYIELPDNLPAGIYFVQLRANGQNLTQKLLVR